MDEKKQVLVIQTIVPPEILLPDWNHSSRRSQAVLLRNGNEAIFRLESSIAQTCKTNKQKISIYHLGRLEIFMHELRKHLVY